MKGNERHNGFKYITGIITTEDGKRALEEFLETSTSILALTVSKTQFLSTQTLKINFSAYL